MEVADSSFAVPLCIGPSVVLQGKCNDDAIQKPSVFGRMTSVETFGVESLENSLDGVPCAHDIDHQHEAYTFRGTNPSSRRSSGDLVCGVDDPADDVMAQQYASLGISPCGLDSGGGLLQRLEALGSSLQISQTFELSSIERLGEESRGFEKFGVASALNHDATTEAEDRDAPRLQLQEGEERSSLAQRLEITSMRHYEQALKSEIQELQDREQTHLSEMAELRAKSSSWSNAIAKKSSAMSHLEVELQERLREMLVEKACSEELQAQNTYLEDSVAEHKSEVESSLAELEKQSEATLECRLAAEEQAIEVAEAGLSATFSVEKLRWLESQEASMRTEVAEARKLAGTAAEEARKQLGFAKVRSSHALRAATQLTSVNVLLVLMECLCAWRSGLQERSATDRADAAERHAVERVRHAQIDFEARIAAEQIHLESRWVIGQRICKRLGDMRYSLLMHSCLVLWLGVGRCQRWDNWWEQYTYDQWQEVQERLRVRAATIRRIFSLLHGRQYYTLLQACVAVWHLETKLWSKKKAANARLQAAAFDVEPTLEEQLTELAEQTAGLRGEVADLAEARVKVKACQRRLEYGNDRGDDLENVVRDQWQNIWRSNTERLVVIVERLRRVNFSQHCLRSWRAYVRMLRRRLADFESFGIRALSAVSACFGAWSRRAAARRGTAHGRQQEARHHKAQVAALLAERDALLESNATYQDKLIVAEELVRAAQARPPPAIASPSASAHLHPDSHLQSSGPLELASTVSADPTPDAHSGAGFSMASAEPTPDAQSRVVLPSPGVWEADFHERIGEERCPNPVRLQSSGPLDLGLVASAELRPDAQSRDVLHSSAVSEPDLRQRFGEERFLNPPRLQSSGPLDFASVTSAEPTPDARNRILLPSPGFSEPDFHRRIGEDLEKLQRDLGLLNSSGTLELAPATPSIDESF